MASPPGPGVDASGHTVVDPTANVVAILQAAVQRQDDLREQANRHFSEIVALRGNCDQELREAETKRLDAIREVDVANVQRAAEASLAAVQALATQVPITAEAVRDSLAKALDPIQTAIQELRRTQYEQQGQQTGTKDTSARNMALAAVGFVALGFAVSVVAVIVTIVNQ